MHDALSSPDFEPMSAEEIKLLKTIADHLDALVRLRRAAQPPQMVHPGKVVDGVFACCHRPVAESMNRGCTELRPRDD